ncbi:MAG: PEGA domain-containing protein [Planctomycetaceae bacterium]|nr:PEGA domain-containing protein [Planctomycetaceae bacterium]
MTRALICSLCPLLTAALCYGCVERRIRFESNIPARVYLDRENIGVTPVEIEFRNYGTREYTLRADGYKTTSGTVNLATPWYEYPVIDFFSEVLIPVDIVDQHTVIVTLEPLAAPEFEGLRERAEARREQANRELAPPPDK